MTTETHATTCPNPACNHSPMLIRHDTGCCFQLEACPSCGFGYGEGFGYEGRYEVKGEAAWRDMFFYWFGEGDESLTATELRRRALASVVGASPDPAYPNGVFDYHAAMDRNPLWYQEYLPEGAEQFLPQSANPRPFVKRVPA